MAQTKAAKPEHFALLKAEAEEARILELAKMLEPEVIKLLPKETATFRIAAAIAERVSFGEVDSMEVARNFPRCCDQVTFFLRNDLY